MKKLHPILRVITSLRLICQGSTHGRMSMTLASTPLSVLFSFNDHNVSPTDPNHQTSAGEYRRSSGKTLDLTKSCLEAITAPPQLLVLWQLQLRRCFSKRLAAF